jgi:hypothetical protein
MTNLSTYYPNQHQYDYAAAQAAYGVEEAPPELAAPSTLSELLITTYQKRAWWISLPLLIPLGISGISYMSGGVPMLADVSFILLGFACVINIIRELIVFPRRYGVGGMMLWGGTLLWFCYDYYMHWLGTSFTGLAIEPVIVSKAVFYHVLFVFCMVLGLQIKKGRWLERVLHAVPAPSSRSLYFAMVLFCFFIGMIPFLFFTNEPFYVAIWKSIWAGRSGEGSLFTTGRTGNLNYNWGGYLAQLCDVGMMGAVLGAFHAIMVSRQIWQNVICWFIWVLWLGIAFGTGARGFTVFLSLPVIILVFLKYSHIASMMMRRFSFRAYVMSAAVAFVILVLVQVQGAFRNQGFSAEQFDEVEVSSLSGNEMFTTSLLGFGTFPDKKDFFYNRVPGEGLVRAFPEEMYWLCIGPIPRALWNSKPVSEVNTWYNNRTTGKDTGAEGTTISNGAVGHPYIRYGPFGVIQFGLFYGWMMGVVERSLVKAISKPMAMLFTLAFATFIFRSYRDLWWHNLYPVIIGGVVLAFVIKFANAFFGAQPEDGGGGAVQPITA